MDLPSTFGSQPALLVQQTQTIPQPHNSTVTVSAEGKKGLSTSSTTTEVQVHPLVLLSILDHHTRRQEGSGRVIGTLLGKRLVGSNGKQVVEITNCFAVPHAERGDEVAIGKDFNRQMLALHLRANRKEMVVGWYATALPVEEEVEGQSAEGDDSGNPPLISSYKCIADTSSLIHEFYAGECEEDPVHLVVDTSLVTDTINLKAFQSTPVQVKGEPLANLFHEIRLAIKPNESERICIDHMIRHSNTNPQTEEETKTEPTPLETDPTTNLKVSMEKLYSMLETASSYVDAVVDGSIPADDAIGRTIADTLSTVPRIRPQVFDKMFNDSLQDLLMVSYLSQITRTQLTIAEKLNASLVV